MVPAAAALLLSYLLGAVPFGFLLVRVFKGIDLRAVGSGNIGATNTMRVLGRPLGVIAFLMDLGKGFVPVALIAPWLAGETVDPGWLGVSCGAAAVCGHVWPVYLRFRGGKGVATGFGALLAIDPWIILLAGIGWLAVIVTTRFVGLASVVMGLLFPVVAYIRRGSEEYGEEVILASLALTILILLRHRSNLERMIAGTEPRIGLKKATQDGESHAR